MFVNLTSAPVHCAELKNVSRTNIPTRKIGISIPDSFSAQYRLQFTCLILYRVRQDIRFRRGELFLEVRHIGTTRSGSAPLCGAQPMQSTLLGRELALTQLTELLQAQVHSDNRRQER